MSVYEPLGNIDAGDCLIGLSFGTSTGHGSPNEQLAHQMLDLAVGRPLIADRTLVNAMPNGDTQMAHIVEGEVTDQRMRGVGTWGTLISSLCYMGDNNLFKPIMIAQSYHVSRVVRQAAKLGMPSIVPEGLPTDFDKNSEQIWTRSPYLWIPLNALGSIVLKRRGQL